MGWAGGGRIMDPIIKALKNNIPDEKLREKIYKPIIDAFEDEDWDTQDECIGSDPAWDKALKKLHPDWEI